MVLFKKQNNFSFIYKYYDHFVLEPLGNELLLVSSCTGLFVNLIKVYAHVPAKAPRIDDTKYIHIPLYSWGTIAGLKLLVGFIYASVIGLSNIFSFTNNF